MVRSYGKRLLPAVILLGLMSTVGTAQDGGVKKFVNQQPGVDARPTLVLAIRTPRGLAKGDIIASFEVVKKKLMVEGKDKPTWAEIELIESSRQGFEQVQSIVMGTTVNPNNPAPEVRNVGLKLRKDQVFEIDCGDPRFSLESMSLTYGDKTENFVVNPDQTNNPLTYNRTHRAYYFQYDPAKYPDPKEYKLKVVTKEATKTKAAEVEDRGPYSWPQERENFWVVKLVGWTGEIDELKKRLGNPDILATPFDISDAKFTTFGIGVMLPQVPDEPREGFTDRNKFQFIIPIGASQSRVARVWMMFPLTKEQAVVEAEKLNSKTFIEVPKLIEGASNVIRVNEAKTVAIKTPVWIEMTKGVGQFERSITIENPMTWQQQQDGPVYRVVVYVMQPEGEDAQAIRLKSPTDPNTFVFGLVKPVPDWKLYRDVKMPKIEKIDPKEKIEKIEPK